MSTRLDTTRDAVSGLLTEILLHFKAGAKITLLVRHPNLEARGADADFVMTSDTLPDAIGALERRRAATTGGADHG